MTRGFWYAPTFLVPLASNAEAATNASEGAGNIATPVSLLSDQEFFLTLLLLLFGLVIIAIEFVILRKRQNDKVEDVSKLFVVTLIIIGTLVLIGAGLSNDQIAPAVGLFGTIAGYLLGRSDRNGTKGSGLTDEK